MKVAVVGAGPAGVYAAEALSALDASVVAVDVFERLPAPFGLVRYGVAPDHLPLRGVRDTLVKLLSHHRVRLLGGVEVGRDLDLASLRRCYDAVVLTYGAATDRQLGVPGEDLVGSIAATDLVNWYCGHPDADRGRVEHAIGRATTAVVIGVGNVAVDVTRVLLKDRAALSQTDMPEHVLQTLRDAPITDVHLLGRRSPVHATWTTKELRELGELDNVAVDLDVPLEQLRPDDDVDRHVAKNLAALEGFTQHDYAGSSRTLHVHFWSRPVALLGDKSVEGIVVERTALNDTGTLIGTGEAYEIDAQLVIRSIGYRGQTLADLPFDSATGTIRNEKGRVLGDDGLPVQGLYAAGWIKRGPTGIIGTNRKDAVETVTALVEDAGAGRLDPPSADVDDVLADRGIVPVDMAGWAAIDAAERALGADRGRDRTTIHDRDELLAAARGAAPPG